MPFIFNLLQAFAAATGGGAVQSSTSALLPPTPPAPISISSLTSAVASMSLGKVVGGGGSLLDTAFASEGMASAGAMQRILGNRVSPEST